MTLPIVPVAAGLLLWLYFGKSKPRVKPMSYVIPDKAIWGSSGIDVQRFLASRGSYLAKFSERITPDGKRTILPWAGTVTTAAHWIEMQAGLNGVNPAWILVSLQREQSLIDNAASKPSDKRLNGALGYAMFDDGTINPTFQGFWRQVWGAAKSAGDTMRLWALANKGKPYPVNYGKDVVVPQNAASALVYRYTPHGSAAVTTHKLYKKYFPTLL